MQHKRKSSEVDEHSSEEEALEAQDDERGTAIAQKSRKQRPPQWMTSVEVPALTHPKSLYHDLEESIDVSIERDVLRDALAALGEAESEDRSEDENDFTAFDIFNFSIYRPHKSSMHKKRRVYGAAPLSNEMMGLHEIDTRGFKHFFMDGWIGYGDQRKYVQHVPCNILSIGNYEDPKLHSVASALWIQSLKSRTLGVWYCLREPAPEYQPYHQIFLWIADFAKHTIDYLNVHQEVTLHHFREDFCNWLNHAHGHDPIFREWLSKYQDTDFRRVLAAYASFVYNEAGLLGEQYTYHPLWSEVESSLMDAVPQQTEHVKTYNHVESSKQLASKTIVTPFVYQCFKHLPWARFLHDQRPLPDVLRQERTPELFNVGLQSLTMRNGGTDAESSTTCFIGDVVAVEADKATDWKTPDTLWYGYVQDVTEQPKGLKLDLLWLYRPTDTACQKMKYPFENELFLGDHCNCGDHPIYAHEVIFKPKVTFSAEPNNFSDFFVRQKYCEGDSAWTTLKASDFQCVCRKAKTKTSVCAGDTWLVVRQIGKTTESLEPVMIEELDDHRQSLRARRLLRVVRDCSPQKIDAAPNELAYSSSIYEIAYEELFRPCQVRFYTIEEKKQHRIPAPYSMQGTGDCFYISYTCNDQGLLKPLSPPFPAVLKQGFDPKRSHGQPMRGLDIFCGGGTLGRGLEEGGSVKMEWAVDYFREAIHTYRANADDPDNAKLFYGSVNDYLSEAMKGKRGNGNLIAQRGEVDVIAAGSPCQGFSLANKTRNTDASQINISMVASAVAFIDFYRPKHAILENVPNMAKCGEVDQQNNVFAQILCSLVAMGYQVRPYLLDAWNFGSPQSRTRLFISVTAPGLTPLPDPPQSHSHPAEVKARALGKTANGLPLGVRYWDLIPFEYATIHEATKDLPLNRHGKLTSIPHPDHRPSKNMSALHQGRIECVPKNPEGSNFIKAYQRGVMSKPQVEAYCWSSVFRSSENCRAWQRVMPNALVPTVTTICVPEDAISGTWLHWEADRPLTVMEVRRAQGLPDHEVLVGLPAHQWKIVGNGVARQVAVSLGLSLRKAWLADLEKAEEDRVACGVLVGSESIDATRAQDADDLESPTLNVRFSASQNIFTSKHFEQVESDPDGPKEQKKLSGNKSTIRKMPSEKQSLLDIRKGDMPTEGQTSSNRITAPTTRRLPTFDKLLRSSPHAKTLMMLPKRKRGVIKPIFQSQQSGATRREAIDISSDDEHEAAGSTAQDSHSHTTPEPTPSNLDGSCDFPTLQTRFCS